MLSSCFLSLFSQLMLDLSQNWTFLIEVWWHMACISELLIQIMACRLFRTRADSRLAASQWETSLQSNTVSHWLGANLESGLQNQAIIWASGYWEPVTNISRMLTRIKINKENTFEIPKYTQPFSRGLYLVNQDLSNYVASNVPMVTWW